MSSSVASQRNPKHHIQILTVSRLFNCNIYVLLTHLTMILIQLRGVFIQPLVLVEIQQGFREGSQWIITSYIISRHQMVQGFLSCVHETVIEPWLAWWWGHLGQYKGHSKMWCHDNQGTLIYMAIQISELRTFSYKNSFLMCLK